MGRRFVVITSAVLAFASVAFGVSRFRKGTEADANFALAAPSLTREAVFHVRWHEKSTARLPAGQVTDGHDGMLTGELDLEADLVLARERMNDGGDAILAELRDVRTSRVVVSGQEVLRSDEAGAKSIERRPIHLVVEGGRIDRVLVDRDATSIAVQITENVARQVLLARPEAGATFERDEETPAGKMHVRYELRGDVHRRTIVDAVALEGLPAACEAPCVVRARGEGEVRFEDGDAIASSSEKREVRAGRPDAPPMFEGTASFEAKRVREGNFSGEALDPSKLAAKLPGEAFEGEAEKKASLARLAEGSSLESVLGGVAAAATSGQGALAKGWLVSSSALLELHPEMIAEVAVRFEDDELGMQGRLAILDLLAATGGDTAQAALLRVLDSGAARQDEAARLVFVQRLMLIETPTGETVRAVRERLENSSRSGDADMAFAEAHVLGAMAGRLAERGSKAEAKASVDALAGALDKAANPTARAAYVSALGNAGDSSQVGRITKHARDEDANVRRSVASALRKTNVREARSTLLGLAKDRDEEVQIAAIDAMAHHPLDAGEQRDLAGLLQSQQLGGEAEPLAVTVLLRQGAPSAEVRASLAQLVERTEDPRLAARIRFALESSTN